MRSLPAVMQIWEGCLVLIPPNESIERPPGRCGDERLEEKRKKKRADWLLGLLALTNGAISTTVELK